MADARSTTSQNRFGFTLIEMLVVIAIIGLLVAIVVPALNKARGQARRTVCATNLRQIGVGFQSYLSETKDRFPFASFLPSTGPFPVDGPTPIFIADILLPHTGGQSEVFHCSKDETGRPRPAPNNGLSYFQSEKSSYEYRTRLAGRTLEEYAGVFEHYRDTIIAENSIWIMRDYENFHGPGGTEGARRYLYGDGHVTDYEH